MRILKIYYFLFLMILSLPIRLSAQKFPTTVGYVNDFANVIPAQYREKITAICLELKQKTGSEIADVTMTTIGDEDYRDYANRLFEAWGIGQRGKDNGILIFNTIKERKLWVEVGYGLEGALPDALVGRILDRYVFPNLKNGDYGKGHFMAVAVIAQAIAKEYGVELSGEIGRQYIPRKERSRGIGGIFTFLIIIFLIIITRGRILPWLFLGSMMGGRGGGRHDDWGGFSGGGGFGGGFGGFSGGMSGGGGAGGGY